MPWATNDDDALPLYSPSRPSPPPRPDSPTPSYHTIDRRGSRPGLTSNLSIPGANGRRQASIASSSGSISPRSPRIPRAIQNLSFQPSRARKNMAAAVQSGDVDEIRRIMENSDKAKALERNVMDNALFCVAQADAVDVLSLLVGNGASIGATRPMLGTPLHVAIAANAQQATSWLIDNEAPLDVRDRHKCTPLDTAIKLGNLNLVQRLVGLGAAINTPTNESKRTTLHVAAAYGKDGYIRMLVENGAEIDAKDRVNGYTALHAAVVEGHHRAANELLQKSADVNAADHDETTPLHLAAKYGHDKAVYELLSHDAIVDAKDHDGNTPLHLAVRQGHGRVAGELLRRGANINAKGKDDNTALHLALLSGHEEVADELLRRGPAVDVENSSSETPLNIAIKQAMDTIVAKLLDMGAPVTSATLFRSLKTEPKYQSQNSDAARAYDERRSRIIDALLVKDRSLASSRHADGYTALHFAVTAGDLAATQKLLEAGANFGAKTAGGGNTALHLAARGLNAIVHGQVAKFLLMAGANVNAHNAEGSSPLHLAVRAGQENMIYILVREGADPGMRDNGGMTPMQIAADTTVGRWMAKNRRKPSFSRVGSSTS